MTKTKRKRETLPTQWDKDKIPLLSIEPATSYDPDSCNDLLQTSIYPFSIVLERRHAVRQRVKLKPTGRQPNTLIEALCIRMPLRLTLQYWERHRVSLADMSEILDKSYPLIVWLLTLLEKIPISNASAKNNYSGEGSIFGGKIVANSKLMKVYNERYKSREDWNTVLQWLGETGQTSMKMDNTKVSLPVHYASLETIQRIKAQMLPGSSDIWFDQPIRCFPHAWKWEGIYVVPYRSVAQHENALFMIRVVPFQEYFDYYGKPFVLAHCPDLVKIGNDYWCTLDEFFYVFPIDSLQSKVKKLKGV